jgi:hypothetical protein
MNAFQVGQTYSTRSACDHDCIISFSVVKRTAQTITVDLKNRGVKTLRVSAYAGNEQVKPWGSYSMAPVVDASDLN